MTDEDFFSIFPDRQARIRAPGRERVIDNQRAVRIVDECWHEFRSLGPHDRKRRRILLWCVPPGSPWFDPRKPPILKIPFLAFADETIEDNDATLLPILHEIMTQARSRQ